MRVLARHQGALLGLALFLVAGSPLWTGQHIGGEGEIWSAEFAVGR